MISLATWFERNGRRPLITLSISILSIGLLYTGHDIWRQRATRENALKELASLISVAVIQNNRALAEVLLESTRSQAGATHAELLHKGRPIISSTGSLESNSFLNFTETIPISGLADYSLVAYFFVLDQFSGLLFFLLLVGLVFGGCLLVLGRLESRFRTDVIAPLKIGNGFETHLPIEEFEQIRKLQTDLSQLRTQQAVHEAVLARDKQVAHDIRSPLTALSVLFSSIETLSESERLLFRRAIDSIKNIANKLCEKQTRSIESPSQSTARLTKEVQPLVPIIDIAVSQARIQWRGISETEIEFNPDSGYGIFVTIDCTELRRVLSNVLNNAFEAIEGKGTIRLQVSQVLGYIALEIEDTGCGIPSSRMGSLGTAGATFDKEGGSGLGLFHAKTTMENWGGKVGIESKLNKGTRVTLLFPITPPPAWFVPSIDANKGKQLVILDDDASIHQIWQHRLKDAKSHKALVHLSSSRDLEEFLSRPHQSHNTYLIDFELIGESVNGLALIEQHKLMNNSILVTSHFLDKEVQRRCEALGVRLLPKPWAGMVPLSA